MNFFPKCFKFNLSSRNAIKYLEKMFGFSDKCHWIGYSKVPELCREYFASAVNRLGKGPKKERFPVLSICEWWKSRIKVLPCRLLLCLGPVNTLSAKGCSETGRAMDLSNDRFRSEWFWKYLRYEPQYFPQNFQNFI